MLIRVLPPTTFIKWCKDRKKKNKKNMKKEIVLKVLVIHNSVLFLLVAGRNMNEVEKK